MDETKNLAKVTDEELVGKLVSALEVQMGEIAYLYSGEPIERAQEVLEVQVVPALLAAILPTLSARHQKELEEAVEKSFEKGVEQGAVNQAADDKKAYSLLTEALSRGEQPKEA